MIINRPDLQQDFVELDQNEVDAKIRPNGTSAITATLLNSVLKQYTNKLEDVVDSAFNLLSDSSDNIQQGVTNSFILQFNTEEARDAILNTADHPVDGQLAVVKTNVRGNEELFIFNGEWNSIYEVNNIKYTKVFSIEERDNLNAGLGDVCVVTDPLEMFIYTNQWVSVFSLNNKITFTNIKLVVNEYSSDLDAGNAGLTAGDVYHTAGTLKIKL